MPIVVPILIKKLENKYSLIFSEENRKKMENKINLLTLKIGKIRSDVIAIDPELVNIFSQWEENFDCLKDISDHLKTKKLTLNEVLKDNLDNAMCNIDTILSECEMLFPSKKIGLQDWNENKQELFKAIELLKQHKDKTLMLEEIVDILQLIKIPTCEGGLYKQFVIGIGINEENEKFTDIFYLLKTREVSFFHRLDVDETWTWLGGEPLSLFQIVNTKLTEHTLDQTTHSICIPRETWFAAKVKGKEQQPAEDDRISKSEEDIFYTLVSCQCIPAFTMSCFHNDINKSFTDCYRQSTAEDQTKIDQLLAPEQRIELGKQSSIMSNPL